MKLKIINIPFLAVILSIPYSINLALAIPGEGIEFDPVSGNYAITYWEEISDSAGNDLSGLSKATFEPATKIDPAVRSLFKLNQNWQLTYRYRLSNGYKSKQMLVRFIFEPVSDITANRPLSNSMDSSFRGKQEVFEDMTAGIESLSTPPGWDGAAVASEEGGVKISWIYAQNNYDVTKGLKPGASQNGFGFISQDLPGIGMAKLQGNVKVYGLKFSGEGLDPTSDIGMQALQLEKNNFVPRNAAVPTIPVPDPFDAAVLLERIQTHMHTWINKQLLDASFSSQLDRNFQSAISAYRLNQPEVGKKEIKTMRKMLKNEHADADKEDDDDRGAKGDDDKTKSVLIDKLAARVLDFDLKYVIKRMGGEKDD